MLYEFPVNIGKLCFDGTLDTLALTSYAAAVSNFFSWNVQTMPASLMFSSFPSSCAFVVQVKENTY
jgi:hypothetical protein